MIVWLVQSAWAKSWCASPLYVHEWGVLSLRTDGAEPAKTPLPSWFHTQGGGTGLPSGAVPVRTLPADSGDRDLPVIQWYAPPAWSDPIPVALEVGFAHGQASAWYPQVDERRPASSAATPQLTWEALALSHERPQRTLPAAERAWVEKLRQTPGALWVSRARQTERFVFYEARTQEKPGVAVERTGDQWTVRNVTDWPVHEVVVVADGQVATLPSLPPGQRIALRPEPLNAPALLRWLQTRWIDAAPPDLASHGWGEDCVMMRDPAEPATDALSHRLFAAEVEALLSVWGQRLASAEPHVAYREDVAALDAVMPLGVYTDMYHYVKLHRLGVVVVEGAW